MVIVFIKAMQVGWAHGVPSAHGGLTRLSRASTTLVRFNCAATRPNTLCGPSMTCAN
jgi:hypothetical protein